jgi:hypothetical protein
VKRENLAKANSKRFTAKLVAALALGRGESMDAGMARMCLTVAMQLFEEADLKLDGDSRKIVGLRPVLGRAAELCRTTFETVVSIFWSYIESNGETFDITDNSFRGRGSATVDKATFYKINEGRCAAIKDFVEYRNSARGQAKVTSSALSIHLGHSAPLPPIPPPSLPGHP